MMAGFHFGAAGSPLLRENRDEAMHFPVQLERLHHLRTEHFQGAAIVVQPDAGGPGDEAIGHHRRQQARHERVLAVLAPPAHDVELLPFINNMAQRLRDCDLIVCRAGAITVSELCAAGVPSILIPLVVSTTAHQRDNAEFMAAAFARFERINVELKQLITDWQTIELGGKRVPNDHEMKGYQADIGVGWFGTIYDESRRNKPLIKPSEDDVRVALEGNLCRCTGYHNIVKSILACANG